VAQAAGYVNNTNGNFESRRQTFLSSPTLPRPCDRRYSSSRIDNLAHSSGPFVARRYQKSVAIPATWPHKRIAERQPYRLATAGATANVSMLPTDEPVSAMASALPRSWTGTQRPIIAPVDGYDGPSQKPMRKKQIARPLAPNESTRNGAAQAPAAMAPMAAKMGQKPPARSPR